MMNRRSKYLNPIERFFLYISKSIQDNGCWLWEGYKTHNGYGRIRINGKRIAAHRFSYEFFKGKIDNNFLICHSCDNPGCVNPDHLWMGTPKDNMRDMCNKNRKARGYTKKNCIGSNHPKAKLNTKKVFLIRQLAREGMTNRALSIKFKINESTISCIKLRRTWKHLC